MNNICQGCGSKFQSSNQSGIGYIPKEKLKESKYCERCFKIIHYGESLVVLTPQEIDNIIETVNNDQKHVLFILDILSLNQDIIDVYHRINYPKTLIINKYDLLKHLIKPNKIKEFLFSYYKVNDNILFISSINNHNVKEIIYYLEKYKINEAYLAGFINAGKSTILNTILGAYNQNIMSLTTSYIPHTTMNFINLKINENLTLIDSPGFSYPTYLSENLELLKKIDVKKKIRAVSYQMKTNESLIIEDLLNITFINNSNIIIYLSNKFKMKKGFKIKKYNLKLTIPADSDLVIKGVGFINFKNDTEIEVDLEDDSLIEIRPTIFGGKYEHNKNNE